MPQRSMAWGPVERCVTLDIWTWISLPNFLPRRMVIAGVLMGSYGVK